MKIKSAFLAPLLVIVVMLLMTASRFVDLGALTLRDNICLAIIVLQILILVVPSIFYIKLRGEGFKKRMRLAPFGIEKLLVTLLATLTLILGDTLLKLLLYNIGAIDGEYSVYVDYLGGISPGVLYSLVTFALMPAIIEELLFRSLLCAEYESGGALTAVILSSALYGMFSMDAGYFPVYFFAGIMFALVMYLTRSVFASMICHFVYSLFDLAAADTVRTILTKPQSMGFLIFALVGLFLVCLAGLFGECERIYYGYALAGDRSAKNGEEHPRFSLSMFTESLLAPTFVAALLVFIVAAMQSLGIF